MTAIHWMPDSEFWSAKRAEHAFVGGYELIAFDLPATARDPAEIGFEVFGPPDYGTLIATGRAETFERARAAAEIALGQETKEAR
jgi:hypothetical protein